LDPEGDQRLRDSYNEKMLPMLKIKPAKIVDLGCSTGLSTMALHKVWVCKTQFLLFVVAYFGIS
jgi:trans-aconitate methyltransferase